MEVFSVKQTSKEMAKQQASFTPITQGRSPQTSEPQVEKKEPVKTEVPRVKFPKLLEIAQQVREKLRSAQVNIEFEVNQKSGRVVVKVLDPISGEVVRKIPPEALAKSIEHLKQMKSELQLQGIELDVKY